MHAKWRRLKIKKKKVFHGFVHVHRVNVQAQSAECNFLSCHGAIMPACPYTPLRGSSAYPLHARVALLKSSSMHDIVRVGVQCFIFHAHKEMSDKITTVCPACLLHLNVSVWCQFTLGPDRQQKGSGCCPGAAALTRDSPTANHLHQKEALT